MTPRIEFKKGKYISRQDAKVAKVLKSEEFEFLCELGVFAREAFDSALLLAFRVSRFRALLPLLSQCLL